MSPNYKIVFRGARLQNKNTGLSHHPTVIKTIPSGDKTRSVHHYAIRPRLDHRSRYLPIICCVPLGNRAMTDWALKWPSSYRHHPLSARGQRSVLGAARVARGTGRQRLSPISSGSAPYSTRNDVQPRSAARIQDGPWLLTDWQAMADSQTGPALIGLFDFRITDFG